MKWLNSSLKQHIKGVNFLIVSGDKVLIQKRDYNTKKYQGWYAIPGGGVDEGETPFEAVVREAFEETGLKLSPADFVYFGNFCYKMDKKLRVNAMFICFVEKPVIKSNEGLMVWMTLRELMGVELARDENSLLLEIYEFIRAIP